VEPRRDAVQVVRCEELSGKTASDCCKRGIGAASAKHDAGDTKLEKPSKSI
jgi:hypothetical protein